MLFGSSRDPTAIAQVDLCQAWTSFQDLSVELKSLISHISICSPGGDGGGGGGGCAAGFTKVLSFTRPNFVTLYQTKNAQLFLISVFCEQSRKTGPYTRPIFYDY